MYSTAAHGGPSAAPHKPHGGPSAASLGVVGFANICEIGQKLLQNSYDFHIVFIDLAYAFGMFWGVGHGPTGPRPDLPATPPLQSMLKVCQICVYIYNYMNII